MYENKIEREIQKFECEKCSRIFYKKDHIKNHFEQVHLKKKKSCKVCKKKFHPLALKRHQQEKCGENKNRFECNICLKTFLRKEHHKTHTQKFHEAMDSTLIIEATEESQLNNELWCIEEEL